MINISRKSSKIQLVLPQYRVQADGKLLGVRGGWNLGHPK